MQLSIQPLSDKVCHVTHISHTPLGKCSFTGSPWVMSLCYASYWNTFMVKLSECCHGNADRGLTDHLSRRVVFFNVTDWKREMNENGKWSIITHFIELQRRECMCVLYIYFIYTLAHTSQFLQLILVFCMLHSSSLNLFKIGA